MKSIVRLSIRQACDNMGLAPRDVRLRCRQFEAADAQPTMPVRSLNCSEAGKDGTRVRRCRFRLGHDDGPAATCSVTFFEATGEHALYWSDRMPATAAEPPRRDGRANTAMPRSSLMCDMPLLALARQPEPVDSDPARPPQVLSMPPPITDDDWPLLPAGEKRAGTTATRLRIGSLGRIEDCVVVASSGSARLDEAACELMVARARFLPARDRRGRAVATIIAASHRWTSPRLPLE